METIEYPTLSGGGGTFVLPDFAPEIQPILGSRGKQDQALARFALAAEKAGVELPGGAFVSVDKTLTEQWNHYIAASFKEPGVNDLAGSPEIFVDDENIGIRVRAESSLNGYRLKPVIDAIESAAPGVGWYVVGVLGKAIGHGLPIYDCNRLGYEAEGYCYGQTTDRECANELAGYDDDGFDVDSASDDEVAAFLADRLEFTPSQVLASVDGHAHLLGWTPPTCKSPRKANRRCANAAIKAKVLRGKLEQVVRDALELELLFRRNKKYHFNPSDALPNGGDLIGATCFLSWDEPEFLMELVAHAEENAYNGGEAVEMLALEQIDLKADQQQFYQLALQFKAYLERWNALARVVTQFPLWERN